MILSGQNRGQCRCPGRSPKDRCLNMPATKVTTGCTTSSAARAPQRKPKPRRKRSKGIHAKTNATEAFDRDCSACDHSAALGPPCVLCGVRQYEASQVARHSK